MGKIAIIIPSRLKAKRLPNKPLKLINNKEMILHVYDVATNAKMGEVYVATPDKEIANLVQSYGGNSVITAGDHQTGTDRIFEVFQKDLKSEPQILINLQGDMPNLEPSSIKILIDHMKLKVCDIGTLASSLQSEKEISDNNIVKVKTKKNIKDKEFSEATDFFRSSENFNIENIYHHIGIYAFTNQALIRYVSLKRSNLEISRNLEQLRALENKMKIDVGYIKTFPLSVDTEKDLMEIKKIMEV
tara:strand:- start:4651 stop:5385 length:735 start_codon:yes stop_codon:yes gene_type:complete